MDARERGSGGLVVVGVGTEEKTCGSRGKGGVRAWGGVGSMRWLAPWNLTREARCAVHVLLALPGRRMQMSGPQDSVDHEFKG